MYLIRIVGSIGGPEYEYHEQDDNSSPWPNAGLGPPTPAVGQPIYANPEHQYWRYNQVTPTGDFAPFPHYQTQSPAFIQNSNAFQSAQQTHTGWPQHQQTSRSLSHGHLEGGAPNNTPLYAEANYGELYPQPQYVRRSLALDTQSPHNVAPGSGAPIAPGARQQYAFVNQGNVYNDRSNGSTTASETQGSFASWYSGPSYEQ